MYLEKKIYHLPIFLEWEIVFHIKCGICNVNVNVNVNVVSLFNHEDLRISLTERE